MTRLDGEGVRVVLVGTGSHISGSRLPDVAAVAATVGAVRGCLVEVCGVREQNLTCLLDPEGPEPFLDAVIAAASAASDVLVVYFVGHGALDVTGQLHLATRATVDLTSRAAYQALPYSEIVGALTNCRARLIVVVLDCCYSGRATIPVRSGALLASADRDEQALAPVGEEHTAFSGTLVAALRDGIPRAPAGVTLQHLHGHLARVMRGQNRPVPVLQTGNDAAELVLAANRADHSDTDEGLVTPWEGECPYRGLESFTAADEEVFHGRAELVSHVLARLRERVRSGGMTVVGGPSGSGKTSVLCAGILPAIAHGDLGVIGSSSWPQITMTPGEDPLGALAAGLGQLGPGQDTASIRAALTGEAAVLRAVVRRVTGEAMPPASDATSGRLVILVDQFEEVFAPGVSDSARLAFIAALDTIAARTQSEDPSAVVILGLRSDFDGQCARFPELLTALENHQVLVGPMTTAQLRSSIVEPARQARIELQPGLVELLLRDTGANPDDEQSADYDPGALPLLSHAVLTTWQHRRGNLLTVEGYWEIGGVAGAISTTAEHTFTALDAEAQDAARWLLLRMVRVGDDTPDTRRRVNRKDLLAALPNPAAAAAVLEAFADARLVTVDRDTAEITHEALIRSWPRLKEWMTADRDGQLLAQEIEADAAKWNRGHQDTALLYRGSRLARALKRAEAPHHGDLSATALEFLSASTSYARRATRRLQGVVVLAVLLLVAVGTAWLTFRESVTAQAERDHAIVNLVVSEAGEQSQVDPSLAAQLDLLAYRRQQTPELRTKLLAADGAPLSQPLIGHTNAVNSVAFSPDGRTLASGSRDATVRLWNVADPAHPTPLGPPLTGHTDAVLSVAFSPDGRTLASGSGDSTVRLWNVADPAHSTTLAQPLTGHTDAVYSVAFSPDGRTLASGSSDHTVRLWNVADPAHPTLLGQPLTGPTNTVFSVAFSPDGHTLASGSSDHTVRLWNVADPAHPTPLGQPLTGHTDEVNSVAFSPDGRTLASGSGDSTVRLWNVADPAHPLTVGPLLIAGGSVVYAVRFGANGQTLATAHGDGSIRWWNLPRTTLTGHTDAVFSVAFSPDGRTLASGSRDNTVQLWNVADSAHPTLLGSPLSGHTSEVFSVAFSPDGHTLASGSRDDTVRLWNVTDPAHPTPLGQLTGHTSVVNSVAFSPDGHTLASGSSDHTVRLWNVADPAHPTLLGPPLTGHTSEVFSVAFSPDGHTLASGSRDHTVRLWNVADPAHPTTLGQPEVPRCSRTTTRIGLDPKGGSGSASEVSEI